ncbi:sodium:solute symporter [Limibacter armeniacum]|uniref:sodium:solute symporter n=1 Tax=Limibacter armeniacum TaxID=466084 RepID=UPI002FE575C6
MTPTLVLLLIGIYFSGVLLISYVTARGATQTTFFTADKNSPWYLVAYGMIGATLSGVTFVSLPGWVGTSGFSYFQTTMGYVLGYAVIATVLLPLYYKLNLVSIYSFLEDRFGFWSYKTAAFFFLLSRTIQAAAKLYIVSIVLQTFLFDELNVPYFWTVFITIALIWLYTFRGGIKTVVWTDVLQTTFMLLAAGITVYIIAKDLGLGFSEMLQTIQENGKYSKTFFWDPSQPSYFFTQFISGAFLALVMTGLDQDMMQKNLTCRTAPDAQKNMFWFSLILVAVNILFLTLGAMLYIYTDRMGIPLPAKGDELFPMLAKDYLGVFAASVFLLGIIAAAYSSADSALTSLTTSFCIDFLNFGKTKTGSAQKRTRRIQVHMMFSLILLLTVILFKLINNTSALDAVLKVATYTYGPLLGLFAFGLLTRKKLKDKWVPVVCALSPLLCFLMNFFSEELFNGYRFGYELLMLNGAMTFLGLLLLSKKGELYEKRLLEWK